MNNPSPEQIKRARLNTGLTQTNAAKIVYRTLNSWQKWEAGDRVMPVAMWELFLLQTKVLTKEKTKEK